MSYFLLKTAILKDLINSSIITSFNNCLLNCASLSSTCQVHLWYPGAIMEDFLEEEMATHSSILAWEIPWTEEPGRLQSMESQKSWTQLSD